MKRPSHAGFTLIELLIVVVIIGILAAIAIPRFASVRDKGYRAAMMSDLKNLATYQDVNHAEAITYSADLTALGFQNTEGVAVTVTEATSMGWAATATHTGVAGEQCGLWYGNASPANGSPATTEGVVACTF